MTSLSYDYYITHHYYCTDKLWADRITCVVFIIMKCAHVTPRNLSKKTQAQVLEHIGNDTPQYRISAY